MKLGKTESGQIKPLDNECLFMHCANGMISVIDEVYFEMVQPLLEIHGILVFEYDWIKKEE